MFISSRRNERYDSSDSKVEYTVGHFSNDEIFEADLINHSEVGLCILSPHSFTVGQEIILKNFMSYSSLTAVVIWVAQCEEETGFNKSDQILFKAGLQFAG